MLQASEGGSKVLWVSLASGILLGNVRLERSDVGHLRNSRSCWIFLFGKVGPFKDSEEAGVRYKRETLDKAQEPERKRNLMRKIKCDKVEKPKL